MDVRGKVTKTTPIAIDGINALGVAYWFTIALAEWAALKFIERPRLDRSGGRLVEGDVAQVAMDVNELESTLAADTAAIASIDAIRDHQALVVVRGEKGLSVFFISREAAAHLKFGGPIMIAII